MIKDNLRAVHPFLNETFRTIEKSEMKSEKVFKELFPNDPVDFYKLEAIYLFQNSEVNVASTIKKIADEHIQIKIVTSK